MISFIMMAKNVENYIKDAVSSLQKVDSVPWELIIIDDHSEDNTFNIANALAKSDSRIRVYKNKYKGKVRGTNYGYSLSKGDIIKCIDSDDVLLPEFFDFYSKLSDYQAHCHSAYITDENLKRKYVYNVNPLILNKDYKFVLENLVSLPKWSWSFKREIAEKVFPLPENLPFEDVWISLSVKKNAESILFIDKPVYLYRQHKNQTFGGIVNFRKNLVIFRANRLLKLIDILENEERVIEGLPKTVLDKAKQFNLLMAKEDLSLSEIFHSNLGLTLKTKIVLIRKFPFLAKNLAVLKWKIDKLFARN